MLSRLAPLVALLVAVPASGGDAPGRAVRWGQLTIHERIVIRIPRERAAPTLMPNSAGWKEKHGPQCVGIDQIAGAALGASAAVDLLMVDGTRVRARLGDDCPALDYYYGFYIKPDPDGKVCASRDAIRSRSGSICPIRDFRRLVPRR